MRSARWRRAGTLSTRQLRARPRSRQQVRGTPSCRAHRDRGVSPGLAHRAPRSRRGVRMGRKRARAGAGRSRRASREQAGIAAATSSRREVEVFRDEDQGTLLRHPREDAGVGGIEAGARGQRGAAQRFAAQRRARGPARRARLPSSARSRSSRSSCPARRAAPRLLLVARACPGSWQGTMSGGASGPRGDADPLVDEARLADAGFALEQHDLPSRLARGEHPVEALHSTSRPTNPADVPGAAQPLRWREAVRAVPPPRRRLALRRTPRTSSRCARAPSSCREERLDRRSKKGERRARRGA